MRIDNGREKPIDFFTKVALILLDKSAIPADIERDDYTTPWKLLDVLDAVSLAALLEELPTYIKIFSEASW